MRNVIFLRSQDPDTDSRLQRYLNALKGVGSRFLIIGWNRSGIINKEIPDSILYHKQAKIGGGINNILPLIAWNYFLLRTLWQHRKEYTTIHSVDFDTCLAAYIAARLLKKKLIIDIYDKYSDSRGITGKAAQVIDAIEKFVCLRADELILPDICRIEQLKIKKTKNINFFENVPLNINLPKEGYETPNNSTSQQFKVSYVGILEKNHRGLEHLIQVASQLPHIYLNIAGAGALEETIKSAANAYKNIKFWGAVTPEKALSILNDCDLLVGMYYKTIKNHLFASPNKYYEHLMLGKPLLTTEGTPPGDKVIQHKTGYAIGETENDLYNLLNNLNKDSLDILGNNARKLWDEKYANYLDNFSEQYLKLI